MSGKGALYTMSISDWRGWFRTTDLSRVKREGRTGREALKTRKSDD